MYWKSAIVCLIVVISFYYVGAFSAPTSKHFLVIATNCGSRSKAREASKFQEYKENITRDITFCV